MRSKRAFSQSCSSSAEVGAVCPVAVMRAPSNESCCGSGVRADLQLTARAFVMRPRFSFSPFYRNARRPDGILQTFRSVSGYFLATVLEDKSAPAPPDQDLAAPARP